VYAVHEHHAAQNLAAENQQATAELTSTRGQLSDLTARVNALAAQQQVAAPPAPVAAAVTSSRRSQTTSQPRGGPATEPDAGAAGRAGEGD